MRLKQSKSAPGKLGGKCLAHRIGASNFQPQVKVVKCIGFCASWVFGFGDLVEKARSLVDPVFTNVNIFLLCRQRSSATKGDGVGDPTLAPDCVKGQDFVEGNPEHFVVKETAGGLVEGFVGTKVMEAKSKFMPSFVDPKALHSEYVHVVGVHKVGVNCPVGWVLAGEE